MPLIIPIFITHRGCPHRCTFCNQQITAGPYSEDMSEVFFRRTVLSHLRHTGQNRAPVQIAFYGGTFTGMPQQEQIRLLNYSRPFLDAGMVHSLRVSTRPDYLDREQLDLLKECGVQTVEVGAQSLMDHVLQRTERGHTAADVEHAVRLLRSHGFEVGLHLMAGLPGDDSEGFTASVERAIALRPQMVRIHPTLVFAETVLEQDYRNGCYEPLSLDRAVLLCKSALLKCSAARIPVIRMGLQTTPQMEKHGIIIAGPHHPAFRLLVEASIFFDRATAMLSCVDFQAKSVVFSVHPNEQSAFRGLKNENIKALQKRFGLSNIRIFPDPSRPTGTLSARCMS